MVVEDPCQVCHGSGRAKSTKSMQIRIPAGVEDGQRIRIKGKGSPGENGGRAGDLYVKVTVRPHKVFGRDGNNLTVDVPVTFPEAALGAEVEVPTLAGSTVRLRIPGPSGCVVVACRARTATRETCSPRSRSSSPRSLTTTRDMPWRGSVTPSGNPTRGHGR